MALKNSNVLGSAGETIVIAGNSSEDNLATSTAIRYIATEVEALRGYSSLTALFS